MEDTFVPKTAVKGLTLFTVWFDKGLTLLNLQSGLIGYASCFNIIRLGLGLEQELE